jgi:hypothetical protein
MYVTVTVACQMVCVPPHLADMFERFGLGLTFTSNFDTRNKQSVSYQSDSEDLVVVGI